MTPSEQEAYRRGGRDAWQGLLRKLAGMQVRPHADVCGCETCALVRLVVAYIPQTRKEREQ